MWVGLISAAPNLILSTPKKQSVREIYTLADELIQGDGKKKLLKQIKQLKKALNLSVLKAQ